MLWYTGSIAEAVTLSKQRKAVFVVYIEGDTTTEFSSVFNSTEVVNKLSDESKFLAIKLKSGSVEYTQFAQIYQFVPVPSLFFIGKNGTPLEVVCATMEPETLCSRIDKVLTEHGKELDLKSQTQNLLQSEATSSNNTASLISNVPSTSNSNINDQPSTSNVAPSSSNVQPSTSKSNIQDKATSDNINVSPSSSNVVTTPSSVEVKSPVETPKPNLPAASGSQSEIVCSGGVCERRPITTQSVVSGPQVSNEPSTEQLVQEAAPPERPLSVDEKVERARELLEIKKKEKELKEMQAEKEKENERRSTGQSVAQLKRWQAEQEYKQIQEERKREKMENHIAREKILKQIAQDRAEQKARGTSPNTSSDETGHPSTNATPPEQINSARIQFKLPGGQTLVSSFPADSTLADVQDYVIGNTSFIKNSFSLWTSFPRQELLTFECTLRELQLVPSAALLVLPKSKDTVSNTTPFFSIYTFLTSIFTTLVTNPLNSIITWIQSLLTPAQVPPTEPNTPNRPPTQTDPRAPGLRYRPPTNVHRLSDDGNDDDENNTWNGNSTQQL